jgi:hypothetical protein
LLSIATSDAVGPAGGLPSQRAIASSARRLARAVAIDDLLAHPGREVGRGLARRLRLRRPDQVARRHGLADPALVLRPRQIALLEHLREHDVAPLPGRGAVGDRVIGRRRGDHAGEQGGLVRLQLARAAVCRLAAAEVGYGAPEIRARRGFDSVGAVAEVDRVQVLGEDLLLAPLAREVVGERGLADLLEDRPAALRARRVLDELLRDRRAALDGAAGREVLPEGTGGAAHVDAVVLVEALVLDRDDRVLHRQRDVARRDDDPALVGERREVVAADVDEERVLRALELPAVLELGQVRGDRHHHPEGGRHERDQREAEQDQRQPQALQPRTTERWVREDRDVGTFGVAHADTGAGPRPAAFCPRGTVDDDRPQRRPGRPGL